MANAHILIDTFGLLPNPQADLKIDSVEAYPRACLLLREALNLKREHMVTIYVRHPVVGSWLTQRAQAYGESQIMLAHITPRSLLEQQWHVAVPLTVSDDAIVRSHLLDISLSPHDGQTFWDALLMYFFGDVIAGKTFPLEHLPSLFEKLAATAGQEALQKPLVTVAFQKRIAEWIQMAKNDTIRTIIQRFRDEPQVFRQDLALYKLLQRYPPALGERILGDMWELCQSLHVDVEDLPLQEEDVQRVLPEITFYLANVLSTITTSTQFFELLQQLSGYIPQEFDAVEQLARSHAEWLSAPLLEFIERLFFPLQERLGARLALLLHLLPPPFPSIPQITWNAYQWLEWIQKEYMPFYTWLDSQHRSDDEVAQQAFLFASWFYEHYRELKNNVPRAFSYNALFQEYERILHEGTVALVLLVDNLNFVYFDELCQLFAQYQFSLEEVKPLFSLIPTATEIGKVGILAGSDDLAHIGTREYSLLLQKVWQPLLSPHKKVAKYLANIGQFRQITKIEHDFYLLNYLPVDRTLHEDDRETGRSHQEQVYDCLAALTKEVAAFAQRFHIEHRLVVYLLSDHGSTKIHRQIINVLPKDFGQREATREKHHRFLAISEERLSSLPPVVSQQCYIIDKEIFKTSESYLIARDYYRFVPTEEHFYVHGGLSPEEVVVPFARFTARFVPPAPPSIRLLSTQFRYAIPSQLQFEVRNLNAVQLKTIRLQLVSEQAEEATIDQLSAHQETTIIIMTRFPKVFGEPNVRQLHLRIRYNAHNRQFGPHDVVFEITLKSLMEVSDDFDL